MSTYTLSDRGGMARKLGENSTLPNYRLFHRSYLLKRNSVERQKAVWHLWTKKSQQFWSGGRRGEWHTIASSFFFFNFYFFISWRLITLQYCSGFCHRLKWLSHGFKCVPHPDPPSHLPLSFFLYNTHHQCIKGSKTFCFKEIHLTLLSEQFLI